MSFERNKVGIVVIGRNEGERLRRALASLPLKELPIVYVDSGSTDGSPDLARAMGVTVHELDPSLPFSPARARREGEERLHALVPDVDYVQFLDGDCELFPSWLVEAVAYLDDHPEVAIVCGMLCEAYPDASIYNRFSPQRWRLPTGDIQACGGIFMIRRQAYLKVGGFNPDLIVREERDLCARIREAGYRVVRLNTQMAKHDSGLHTFSQWWLRAVWGGYGDAAGIALAPKDQESKRRIINYLSGPLAALMLVVAGSLLLLWSWWGVLGIMLGGYLLALQFARIAVARVREGDPWSTALLFSLFSLVRNIACGIGFLQFFISKRKRQENRPDPHRANNA